MTARALDRFLNALPDAITAGYFLILWLSPLAFGDHGVRNAMLIMLVEFIVINASGFLSGVALAPKVNRTTKLKVLLGFAAFYLLFIAAWSYSFKAWWPFVAFAWLWVGKAMVALDKRRPAVERQWRMQSGCALSVIFYLLGAFATILLPIPKLGFSGVSHAQLALPGSGDWVDRPYEVIAFGALYFGLLALSKWRDWLLPFNNLPAGATSARRPGA